MPTTKKRVHISLPDELGIALASISERDKMPLSTKATELLKIAIELEEDDVFNKIAEERAKQGGKMLSHEEVWG